MSLIYVLHISEYYINLNIIGLLKTMYDEKLIIDTIFHEYYLCVFHFKPLQG